MCVTTGRKRKSLARMAEMKAKGQIRMAVYGGTLGEQENDG